MSKDTDNDTLWEISFQGHFKTLASSNCSCKYGWLLFKRASALIGTRSIKGSARKWRSSSWACWEPVASVWDNDTRFVHVICVHFCKPMSLPSPRRFLTSKLECGFLHCHLLYLHPFLVIGKLQFKTKLYSIPYIKTASYAYNTSSMFIWHVYITGFRTESCFSWGEVERSGTQMRKPKLREMKGFGVTCVWVLGGIVCELSLLQSLNI